MTGGVPRYLEEIDPSLSADGNIARMCFSEDGPLFKDFNAIFSDVFGSTSLVKADILRRLAEGGPATCSEIAARLGVGRGGSLSRNLTELHEAGFVSKDDNVNPATGRKAKESRYRVCDNYVRFYLKYIEPHEGEIRGGRYGFGSLAELRGWESDKGFQFENLVANHALALVPHLHLEGTTIRSVAPFVLKGKRDERRGTMKFLDSEGSPTDTLPDDALKRTLFVQGGAIKPLSPDSFNGLDIVFSNSVNVAGVNVTDVALAIDLDTEDADLRTYGLRNTKTLTPLALSLAGGATKVPVRLTTSATGFVNPRTVAVMTVRSEVADETFAKLSIRKPSGIRHVAVKCDVVVDAEAGTSTLMATVTNSGLMMIFK